MEEKKKKKKQSTRQSRMWEGGQMSTAEPGHYGSLGEAESIGQQERLRDGFMQRQELAHCAVCMW